MARRTRSKSNGSFNWVIALLLAAYRCANSQSKPAAKLGLSPAFLKLGGMTDEALESLIAAGRVRMSAPLSPGIPMIMSDDVAIYLTPAGAAFAEAVVSGTVEEEASKPWWDGDNGALWWTGRIILQVGALAKAQRVILADFQAHHWLPHIENPLAQQEGINRARQLIEVCKRLNRRQHTLRFHAKDKGSIVGWAVS